MMLLLLLLWLAFSPAARSQTPPRVDAAAEARAERIRAMPDTDPVARINQVLAARDLDDAALFALAGTHPGLVEQIVSDEYDLAIAYLSLLPAPELHRIRRGETVIRSKRVLVSQEYDAALALAESFEFAKFKEKKLDAVRVGPLEARVFRVEVTIRHSRKKHDSAAVELAWPSTPQRDEQSRDYLSKHFGARPSRTSSGVGMSLALRDGSFEDPDSLTKYWQVADGVMLGTTSPVGEVSVDTASGVDGTRCVRFFNTDKTRLFKQIAQQMPVTPGTHLRARAQHKADKLRVEHLQREGNVYLEMLFVDATGNAIGTPARATARLATHAWELLEVQAQAPADAATVQVALLSAVSGTSWFDGVVVEVVQ